MAHFKTNLKHLSIPVQMNFNITATFLLPLNPIPTNNYLTVAVYNEYFHSAVSKLRQQVYMDIEF